MIIRPLHFFFQTYFRRFICEVTPLLDRQNLFRHKTLQFILPNWYILKCPLFQCCTYLLLPLGYLVLSCITYYHQTVVDSPHTFHKGQCLNFPTRYVCFDILTIPRWISPGLNIFCIMNNPHVLIKPSFLSFGFDKTIYYFLHKRIFCFK